MTVGSQKFRPEGRLPALLAKDSDSGILTLLRSLAFASVPEAIRDIAEDLQPVYGITVTTFQETCKFVPEIKLMLSEDFADGEKGYAPCYGEISVRLIGETSETLYRDKNIILANRIEAVFVDGGKGVIWRKGWHKVTYLDKGEGYDLRLLVYDEAAAKQIVAKVLDIQNHQLKLALFQYAFAGSTSRSFSCRAASN